MRTTFAPAFHALLLGLVSAAAPGPVLGCSFYEPPAVSEITFFDPEVLGDPALAPLFVDPENPFPSHGAEPDVTTLNLGEWDAFFAGRIPTEAWSAILYRADPSRVDGLIALLEGQPEARRVPEDEAFLAYPEREALIAALDYVAFAKQVERYAVPGSGSWGWQRIPGRYIDIDPLTASGHESLAATSLPFLRQRYAFQLLRLYFYGFDNDPCVAFFDEHRAEAFADGSSVAWRALGYVAGVHHRAKRFAQANYFYSLIFDHCAPLRMEALWSFHPQEEADWRDCLALARSDRERAVLWQMLGITVDGLRAMREIRAIDARSDLLALLLVREVAHAELAAGVSELFGPPPSWPSEYLELLAFIEVTAAAGGTREPWLWELAAGHLRAMAGEVAAANRHLKRAERRAAGNDKVRHQARRSRFYATLQGMTGVDHAAEPDLARELAWVKADPGSRTDRRPYGFLWWAKRRLAGLYRASREVVTALCLDTVAQDQLYADHAVLDRLVAFLERPGKSAFEAFVAGEYYPYRRVLTEVRGLNALYAGEVEEAARLLETAGTKPLPADPFEMHTHDNHDRDARRPGHAQYSKVEAGRRLAAVLRVAEAGGGDAAAAWYEAGSAFYNFTYFGNSRAMYATDGMLFVEQPRAYDCSRAEACFRKAYELASDRELKAQAAFMAAKCELAAYYVSDRKMAAGSFIAGRWFATLADELADTEYYREVLAECGCFRTYEEKRLRLEASSPSCRVAERLRSGF